MAYIWHDSELDDNHYFSWTMADAKIYNLNTDSLFNRDHHKVWAQLSHDSLQLKFDKHLILFLSKLKQSDH